MQDETIVQNKEDKYVRRLLLIALMFLTFFLLCMLGFITFACTTSVTTITTRGTAEDVVDENQTANPTISPNIDR